MKRTMTAIAALTMSAGLAYAEGHSSMDRENLIRTRDITGGEIYVMSVEMDDTMWGESETYTEVDTEWNDIGEIEDIILSRDGQMIGIVAEIGGFLDIADKHVIIPLEDVKLVAVDDKSYAYVTRKTEEQLEQLEDVDEGWWN